jgi:heavy metal sensor kinase
VRLPIRTRLTAVYCGVFCLCTAVVEIGAYVGLKAAIDAIADRDLQARLIGVEDFLNQHISKLSMARLQGELRSHGALQPEFLQIAGVRGQSIFQAQSMRQFTGSEAGRNAAIWTVNGRTRPLRVLSARRTIGQLDYDLHLATDLTVPFEILRRFGLLLLFSSPVVLACASIIGYWIGGRALAPVAEIATAARSIGAADLSRRVAVPASGDELQYLAETLNGMLSRLEAAFGHVSQFTANASHELRTPLALIRATAEVALLRVSGTADSYREALHRILSEAGKNTILLDDMLRLAQADSGARMLRTKPVDLGENVRQACERVTPLARGKGVDLRLSIADRTLYVSADADHLRRLWLILLDNAIKYTPSGRAIEIRMFLSAAGSAICEVKDSGIGITDTDLPHIFERFFRADKARDRKEGGAGLGLSIAQWIVGAHGASIEVESTVGAGSTFRVVFPQLVGAPPRAMPKLSLRDA